MSKLNEYCINMCAKFKGIPDNIESDILCQENENFDPVYRAIRHTGPLVPEDFYPTFADEMQKMAIEKQRK